MSVPTRTQPATRPAWDTTVWNSVPPTPCIYNEGVRVVKEGPRRFAVYAKDERWGHFRLLRDAKTFADDVRFGRAFLSDAAARLIR